MAPFDLAALGTFSYALPFVLIGIGFGATLEAAGFGDTRKLAGQFYFRDLTVLKVMFTGIIVAAVLLALANSFGLLDMSRVWVNPTYLWPGIIGGLVMGVGFIVGGFCPGTSVVASATLKLDGMAFLGGVLGGVWLFGETVANFEGFFLSSAFGRFTLPMWLGVPEGLVVLGVVVMALGMFWLGEAAEDHFGKGNPWRIPSLRELGAARVGGAAALVALAGVALLKGVPTPMERFALLGEPVAKPLAERAVFVHPAEVVSLRNDFNVQARVIDLRDERDFNLFHVGGSTRATAGDLSSARFVKSLVEQPGSTVTFLVGNGEAVATDAWKQLRAQGVNNLYVIEGGINRWLELYPPPACVAAPREGSGDALRWAFNYSVGASIPSALPEIQTLTSFAVPCTSDVHDEAPGAHDQHHGITWPNHPFPKRVKLEKKAAVKGGCG